MVNALFWVGIYNLNKNFISHKRDKRCFVLRSHVLTDVLPILTLIPN